MGAEQPQNPTRRQLLRPDLVWCGPGEGGGFRAGVQVQLDGAGRIEAVGEALDSEAETEVRDMPGRALLPGFVDAHSHAFQRGLRGLGETFPAGAGSFWTWREAMYGLVGRLDAARFHAVCEQAFREMLAAGITTVGEFHYLHHLGGAAFEADALVLDAARAAGLRIVLLQAAYQSGGLDENGNVLPLRGGQERFDTTDTDSYWRQIERLEGLVDGDLQRLGVVAHSVRAVPRNDLAALHAEAKRRGLVFHLHLEEQRQEIEQSLAAYGARPMDLLLDACDVDQRTTAVHCTHSTADGLHRYLATGANVCLCPLTEANLADGVADLETIRAADGPQLCLGSDSNARISMFEEMRWTEYVQRLTRERRGVWVDGAGHCGRPLLEAATVAGARALGLDAGRVEAGLLADLITIDLDHPSLADAETGQRLGPERLEDALVLGAPDAVVAEVCVGGRWVR